MPHHGGNTYAGGTGGTDTAGLGGLVGPYRLDKGHPIHQVSPEDKKKVPQHIIDEAKRMGKIALEKIVEKMSHAVADCFQVKERGYIREGYYADLVIVDMNQSYTVSKENILYKCGWSPLEGKQFPATITHSFVNGHLVYGNGVWNESQQGQRLSFDR